MNEKPEDIVKKACLDRLDQWQRWCIVIDYDDVSGLGRHMTWNGRWLMHTKKGKRDIIVHFKVGKIVWVYLIECKAPDGGVWKKDQQKYAQKFEGLDNVIYEVINNPQQIDDTLERITDRTNVLLKEGGDFMFPPPIEEETF